MAITKGARVEFENGGETVEAIVVAYYTDLFTGRTMVGTYEDLNGLGVDTSGEESEFSGFDAEGRVDVPVSEIRLVSEEAWRAKHPACSVAGPGCTGRDEVQVRENPFDADMHDDHSQHPICQTCYEFLVDEL
jgi:hypothetical protein